VVRGQVAWAASMASRRAFEPRQKHERSAEMVGALVNPEPPARGGAWPPRGNGPAPDGGYQSLLVRVGILPGTSCLIHSRRSILTIAALISRLLSMPLVGVLVSIRLDNLGTMLHASVLWLACVTVETTPDTKGSFETPQP